MAPTIVVSEANSFPGKMTTHVFLCTGVAAFGGLMFGYDIGISGGVTSMDEFLSKFFPDVYKQKHTAKEDNYCKYDNHLLQLFTSSLYLAAIVASWVASSFCKRYGRKITMQLASIFFLVGAIANCLAENLIPLILGRICLGIGVGFGNTAVPLFISEIAPNKYRGGLNVMFQLMVTIGILVANLVNYAVSVYKFPYAGWRISLGGAAVPALLLLLGSLAITETPPSLIERGHPDKGFKTLKKIRGTEADQEELEAIVKATEQAKQGESSFKAVARRSNRPQLIVSMLLQVFQQFTGINVIMFYAPVLFQTIGLGNDASLISSAVTGGVNVAATVVANFVVDKCGRRVLLIEAAVQMFIALSGVGYILNTSLTPTSTLTEKQAKITLALICLFVSGFAWSWGPLGWLIPSEIFPMEARNAGFFWAVSTNMFFTFVVAQCFLTALCFAKSYIFFFFAGCVVVMFLFACFLLPETKGIPIDEMTERVWKKHRYWKKYYPNTDTDKPVNTKETEVVAVKDS